jgi:hypothetical protein
VLCHKFVDPATGHERAHDSWLSLDREYSVLSVYAESGRQVLLRIESEGEGTPALFPAEMFVTTSAAIPRNWRVHIEQGGAVEFAPESWLKPGFWEEFFNQVPEAVEAYENERAIILSEEA